MIEMTLVDTAPRRTAVIHLQLPPRDLPAFLGRALDAVAAAVTRQDTHVTSRT